MKAAQPVSETVWNRVAILVALVATVTVALLNVRHDVLAVPYENDFSVLAARSESLTAATQVDGFWPAGYPVLLWLTRHLVPDALVAGKMLAALLAFGLALSGYWLLKALVAPGVAVLGQVALVLNWYMNRPSLFLGSDLPWAVLTVLALGLAVRGFQNHRLRWLAAAGATAGLSFLVRFPGLLFPIVLAAVLLIGRPLAGGLRRNARAALGVVAAFVVFASPQLILNTARTGDPLFSTQAKNIWFGVYGEGDWRAHWGDVSRTVTVLDVVRRDPVRFAAHWGKETVRGMAMAGSMAVGAVPDALEAAGWPLRVLWLLLAGLLAAGLLATIVVGVRELRVRGLALRPSPDVWLVVVYGLAYVASLGVAFVEPRFLLPLLPLLGLPLVLLGVAFMRCVAVRWLSGGLLLVLFVFLWLNSWLAYNDAFRTALLPVREVQAALGVDRATATDRVLSSVTVPFSFGDRQHAYVLLEGEAGSPDALRTLLVEEQASYFLYDSQYGPRYWPKLEGLLTGELAPAFLTPLFRSEQPAVRLYRVEAGP